MDDCININCDKLSVCKQEVNVYKYMGDKKLKPQVSFSYRFIHKSML